MSKKPYAATILTWLKNNGHSLAPLTSRSTEALLASVQLVPLWSAYGSRSPEIAAAWAACVNEMEEHTRQLAFHAVARVYDWDDRYKLWCDAGFTELPMPCYVCTHEPRNRAA